MLITPHKTWRVGQRRIQLFNDDRSNPRGALTLIQQDAGDNKPIFRYCVLQDDGRNSTNVLLAFSTTRTRVHYPSIRHQFNAIGREPGLSDADGNPSAVWTVYDME